MSDTDRLDPDEIRSLEWLARNIPAGFARELNATVEKARAEGACRLAAELLEVELPDYETATVAEWLEWLDRSNAILAPHVPQAATP